ncbi:PaaX family transcriptional regulator C-terminal domain-containing protein [Cellulomonas sp. NPDC057328]|uniref:PaaX family transcriptional regulator n=1 Tax=Cellulomonas sp. NPDC057328 TaxID=3346101 RepID=UPI003640874B
MEAHDDVDAPRAQAGPSPQHLLARAALSRLARRGLVAVRDGGGRAPAYHLTAGAIARHRSTMHRFLAFGAVPRAGDGEWLAVSYSLPEARQPQRHALRRTLGALGLVRLYDSVWIGPDPDPAAVRGPLADLLDPVPGARWSVLRVRFDDEQGPHGPLAAYDVDGLAAAYRAFVDAHTPLREAVRRGNVGPAEALVARTVLMDAWRRLVLADPDLPAHLLPASWPRDDARRLLVEVHTALGAPARERLVEVLTPAWPDAAAWVTYFVAADDPTQPPRRADAPA